MLVGIDQIQKASNPSAKLKEVSDPVSFNDLIMHTPEFYGVIVITKENIIHHTLTPTLNSIIPSYQSVPSVRSSSQLNLFSAG